MKAPPHRPPTPMPPLRPQTPSETRAHFAVAVSGRKCIAIHLRLTSTLNSLFISERKEGGRKKKCHRCEFARFFVRPACVRVCARRDVITLMAFHWDSSLNVDIKAVGCFYICMGGLMCGGHSGSESSVMHNGSGAQIHTGTQSPYK